MSPEDKAFLIFIAILVGGMLLFATLAAVIAG